MFGEKIPKGYKFNQIVVEVVDNDTFKGFDIGWSAEGIGFGHIFLGWGIDLVKLKDYPAQQGLHADTERMSEEFVRAVLRKAIPQIAKIIMDNDK